MAMVYKFLVTFFLSITLNAVPAAKKLNVVTTLPVLKALTEEVGGSLVTVVSLSRANQDPHYIKPVPTLNALVAKADIFVKIGMDFEMWAGHVLAAVANKKLVGNAVVEASARIRALEIPKKADRDLGDIHDKGNPHIWLSPINALKMADTIKAALIAHDPAHKAQFDANYTAFERKIAESLFGADLVKAIGSPSRTLLLYEGKKLNARLLAHKKTVGGWLKLAERIDYSFMSYHTVWSYLADTFSLKVFPFNIEEKPGMEPTPRYQIKLIAEAKDASIKHIVVASYYEAQRNAIKQIAEKIGARELFIDVDCKEHETYIAMMDRILKSLVDFKGPVTKK